MGRLFLLLLAAAFVVGVSPPLRAKAAPHVERGLNPLYVWSAKTDVNDYREALLLTEQIGRQLPAPAEFSGFLRNRYSPKAIYDPWGTPYYLKIQGRSLIVGSAGPDREPGTDDDVLSEPMTTKAPPRRR
jgi:hypothetical protein